jgi:hypothetical protein
VAADAQAAAVVDGSGLSQEQADPHAAGLGAPEQFPAGGAPVVVGKAWAAVGNLDDHVIAPVVQSEKQLPAARGLLLHGLDGIAYQIDHGTLQLGSISHQRTGLVQAVADQLNLILLESLLEIDQAALDVDGQIQRGWLCFHIAKQHAHPLHRRCDLIAIGGELAGFAGQPGWSLPAAV